MAYFAPNISSSGLSVPSFTDIQQALVQAYQSAYGPTVYLGNDSADFQWISAVALKLSDNMGLCQLAYNNRSPLTAIGAGLDGIVKLNGIARLPSTYSTALLTITGTPGAVLNNLIVSDSNGNLWALPETVTIGTGGTVTVLATCETIGAISAEANTITTPVGGYTAGLTSVTNPSPATTGALPEADSQLRARQSISVALPSETRLAGTIAALLALSGVTRINVLENQTSATDSYGNESHSLTCVVEGGSDLDVATAIYDNRGIGCNTQGATATTMTIVAVTDPNTGNVTNIGFVRPTYVPIFIGIQVHGLNSNFTTATQTAITTALVNYLNDLEIGEEVTLSALYAIALSVVTNLTQPSFSVKALTLDITASSLFTAIINNGGTGYAVNDTLTVVQTGASGGTIKVTSVSGGVITGLASVATAGGTGYSKANGLATTGGTGTGATVNITAVAPSATSDIILQFYKVAQGVTADVVLAVV